MSTTTTPTTDLEDRDVRALTEPMVVDADDPELWGADEAAVYSEDRRYVVNLAAPYCDCEDQHYRTPDGGCKHLRRARFALGRREVPAWVQMDRLDDPLRRRLEDDS
jgi:hypothetical protein